MIIGVGDGFSLTLNHEMDQSEPGTVSMPSSP